MKNTKNKSSGTWNIGVFIAYLFAASLTLLYSYTQVDLGLTLTRQSFWLTIQKLFQNIGYFHRPESTVLFLVILAILFFLYTLTLFAINKGMLSKKTLWSIIILFGILLPFSYPAFSYDFFNYMFTAKTVLLYHKNPYEVIPLNFIGFESWLSFMHWTHLPSAYTPLWILVTLPLYFFGFGYFLLIMWNMKLFLGMCYVAAAFFIGKILRQEHSSKELLGVAIFALNPLVIIECLISSHNDIVMMALILIGIFFYKEKKRFASWVMLALSIGMKLMTIFTIPSFLLGWRRYVSLILMLIGFGLVVTQREVLSWYWVWIMPFIALIPENIPLTILAGGVSMGLLLRYAPFLYFGHWNDPVPLWKAWVTAVPIVIALLITLIVFVRLKRQLNKG